MKLLISGYYGFNNTGDEAILESLVLGFKKIDPNIRLTFLSNNPDQTKRQYNVGAVSRNNLFSVLFCDAFISGGGGLLQDKTSSKSLWYYLGLVRLAQLLGKKTFIIGQGIGPIRSKLNNLLLKSVLKRCTLITVRDQPSYDLINSFKLNNVKLVKTADLAFLLSPQKKESTEIDPNLKPVFGVSVRQSSNWEELCPKIAQLCDLLFDKYRAQIAFIPFQWPQDIIACNQVRRKMKNKATLLGDAYDPPQMLGLTGQLDFLLGMRLHSLIFGVSSLVPCFGISYDPKVGRFMEEASLPYADIRNFSPENIIKEISLLLDNRTGVIKSLSFIKQELYAKSIDNFVLSGSLLKQGE